MTHNMIYLLAELHRAMHQGCKTLEVSCLDLSEALATIERYEGKEKAQFSGVAAGWVNIEKLNEFRRGNLIYMEMRRKKNEKYNVQVFTAPRQKPLEVVAESIHDSA